MEEKVKVSVVVPVWNPGPGIVKCIARLRTQTLREIEMIFVDDRGTDQAMEHIREAAAEDARIRILVNPENRGPGYSRNAGMEAAEGMYVSFIDPDDYAAPDYLERLYSLAEKESLDIAKGRIVYEKEDGTAAEHEELNDVIRAGIKAGKPIYTVFSYEHHSAIYRRNMLQRSGVRYGLARRAQDTTFLLRACHAAGSIGLDDQALYFFCERAGSSMHVFDLASLDQRLFSFQEQVDYLSTALAGDAYAPAYTNALFLSNLRFFACYEPVPEHAQALEHYCAGMRRQVLRLPFANVMKQRCYPVRALLEHGVLLPATPGYLPWEHAPAESWLELVRRWTEHLRAYPGGAASAAAWFNQICEKAERAGTEDGCIENVRREITAQRVRLPANVQAELRKASFFGKAARYFPKALARLLHKLLKRS